MYIIFVRFNGSGKSTPFPYFDSIDYIIELSSRNKFLCRYTFYLSPGKSEK